MFLFKTDQEYSKNKENEKETATLTGEKITNIIINEQIRFFN